MYKKMLLAPVMAIACVLTLVLAGCGGASAEDLIRENIESYMGEIDGANEEFVAGLEASAGEDLELLGLSADEFAAANSMATATRLATSPSMARPRQPRLPSPSSRTPTS